MFEALVFLHNCHCHCVIAVKICDELDTLFEKQDTWTVKMAKQWKFDANKTCFFIFHSAFFI